MTSTELKHVLRKKEFPNCALESLTIIESFLVNRSKQDFAMEVIAEFIFLEKTRDIDTRKSYINASPMTLIQEFQLVVVLSEYFSRPGPDFTRNAMFLSLFGVPMPGRSSVLVKLISTAISGSIAPLLCAVGTWMQQLGCTSLPSTELAQNLVKDFIIFSKKASEQLTQLPLVAPRFAANFMTAVTDIYLNDVKGGIIPPPEMLLDVFTDWVLDNPNLCLAAQQPLSLPSGAIPMPVVTPFVGLIRWSVLGPLVHQKNIYSKLHLAILESMLHITSTNGTPTALNSQHLVTIVSILKKYARNLLSENINPETDEYFQCSLERYAQAIQVAIASKCLYGSLSQLLCSLETLPSNSLMDIVIKANKIL